MKYPDHVRLLEAEEPTLARAVAEFSTLEHVLNWMQREGLPLGTLDLVAQDEFSHDLLVPLPDGRWLAFGLT